MDVAHAAIAAAQSSAGEEDDGPVDATVTIVHRTRGAKNDSIVHDVPKATGGS
jgi:hypothetical protein